MSAPRAVLFDFTDTLAYMQPRHLGLYVRAAAEHGIEVSEDTLAAAIDSGWRRWETPDGVDHSEHSHSEQAFRAIREELHRARLEAAGVRGDLDGVAARIADLECDAAHFHLYDDTLPALERLRAAGVRAVVVSNHVWRLPEVCEELGIAAYLDAVLTSARVGYRKPHPAFYRAAIEAAGAQASELLFVGDSRANDVDGPRAAGMRAVLLDRDGASDEPSAIRTLLDVPL